MSMTTPRVTVPVEPTEAMLEAAESVGMTLAGSDMSSPDMTRHIWAAMLSAAPAPEGGAVTWRIGVSAAPARSQLSDDLLGCFGEAGRGLLWLPRIFTPGHGPLDLFGLFARFRQRKDRKTADPEFAAPPTNGDQHSPSLSAARVHDEIEPPAVGMPPGLRFCLDLSRGQPVDGSGHDLPHNPPHRQTRDCVAASGVTWGN